MNEDLIQIVWEDGTTKTVPKGYKALVYSNGARVYADDGTLLDEEGDRSVFDDVDE